jgi:hypothetical protein
MIYDDHIQVCFLRSLKRKDDALISATFIRELENSLQEVKRLARTIGSAAQTPPD